MLMVMNIQLRHTSDWCFFAPCINILTHLLTYIMTESEVSSSSLVAGLVKHGQTIQKMIFLHEAR